MKIEEASSIYRIINFEDEKDISNPCNAGRGGSSHTDAGREPDN